MMNPPPSTPPSPAGPSPPAATCPKCGAAVSPSSRFCPACGQPIQPAAAAAGGAPPVDIRERVDEDRGVLKKLQLLVPGFRGYRQGEDLREADSVLRLQVADKVHSAISMLTQRRQALSTAGRFDTLNDLALSIADLTRLEGEIRHAEQGYTGISPALRVTVQGQDQLYEYDYGFALAANDLMQTASGLPDPSADPAAVKAATGQLRQMVTRLEQAFQARIRTIQQVQVP
ncbi:MAG TPA: zinc ribbon domain-containing protein [Thermoplasmata archaeon]|nr:zinc ribbon domain-containing protein [Thermoplasmata archaeon]